MFVGDPVSVARLDETHRWVAVGGREHDLKVWDLETQQNVWKARNVKHDFLDMRVPVWITDAHVRSDLTLVLVNLEVKSLPRTEVHLSFAC